MKGKVNARDGQVKEKKKTTTKTRRCRARDVNQRSRREGLSVSNGKTNDCFVPYICARLASHNVGSPDCLFVVRCYKNYSFMMDVTFIVSYHRSYCFEMDAFNWTSLLLLLIKVTCIIYYILFDITEGRRKEQNSLYNNIILIYITTSNTKPLIQI